jgi:hypothetical protein
MSNYTPNVFKLGGLVEWFMIPRSMNRLNLETRDVTEEEAGSMEVIVCHIWF